MELLAVLGSLQVELALAARQAMRKKLRASNLVTSSVSLPSRLQPSCMSSQTTSPRSTQRCLACSPAAVPLLGAAARCCRPAAAWRRQTRSTGRTASTLGSGGCARLTLPRPGPRPPAPSRLAGCPGRDHLTPADNHLVPAVARLDCHQTSKCWTCHVQRCAQSTFPAS